MKDWTLRGPAMRVARKGRSGESDTLRAGCSPMRALGGRSVCRGPLSSPGMASLIASIIWVISCAAPRRCVRLCVPVRVRSTEYVARVSTETSVPRRFRQTKHQIDCEECASVCVCVCATGPRGHFSKARGKVGRAWPGRRS
jgi:hypothetical protein